MNNITLHYIGKRLEQIFVISLEDDVMYIIYLTSNNAHLHSRTRTKNEYTGIPLEFSVLSNDYLIRISNNLTEQLTEQTANCDNL